MHVHIAGSARVIHIPAVVSRSNSHSGRPEHTLRDDPLRCEHTEGRRNLRSGWSEIDARKRVPQQDSPPGNYGAPRRYTSEGSSPIADGSGPGYVLYLPERKHGSG